MTIRMSLAALALLALPRLASASWFDPDTKSLLESAKPLESDKDADVVILADEADVTFEADGRRTLEYRTAYRIVTRDALDDWSTVQASWSPWYEDRPVIRVRVIAPDGSVQELDTATLVERAAREVSDAVFDDQRVVGAPLPSLTVGSIVETSTTTRETRPYFERGVDARFRVGGFVPVRRVRFRATAPASLPLKVELFALPGIEATRVEADGKVEVTVEASSLAAYPLPEPSSPPDRAWLPYVEVASGSSWKEVAGGYAAIVDGKLKGASLDSAMKAALHGAATREAKIAALTQWLHEKVRYTGVEFGASAIVPAAPGETLARGYGDCKDKSLLLVALLRRAGIDADLALLLTGPDPEIAPGLPGLGLFDHAIVRVGGTPPVWIDATDDAALPGVLAPGVAGRKALIVSPATDALVDIPLPASSDNREETVREVFIPERGPARIVETTRGSGLMDRDTRSAHAISDPDEVRKNLEKAGKDAYDAKAIDRIDVSKPNDLSKPFAVSVAVSGAKTGAAFVDGSRFTLDPARMWDDLNNQLPDASEEKRVAPIWISKPFVVTWVVLVHLPPGMDVASLPEDGSRSLGPARMTTQGSRLDDGTVRVRFEADSGKRLWTEEEAEAFRTELKNVGRATFSFEQAGYAHRVAGRYKEALAECRRLAALHPKEALHVAETAEVLLAAGLGEAARREARRAVEVDPKSADGYRELGWVLLHDEAGRLFRDGCDLGEAERAYRSMKAIDGSDPRARANLALLLEHDSHLVQRGSDARLADAVVELKAIRTELNDKTFDTDLLTDLAILGRYDEMLELVPSVAESTSRSALELVAVCGKEGIGAALARAQKMPLTDAARRDALLTFGRFELSQRKYPEASKAFSSAATGASNAVALRALAEWTASLERSKEEALDLGDPKGTVRALMRGLLQETTPDALSDLGYATGEAPPSVKNVASVITIMRRTLAAAGASPEMVEDMLASTAKWSVEGDATIGWRVELSLQVPGKSSSQHFFLLEQNGKPRILTAGIPFAAAGHVLDLIDRGELAGAKTWLDWATGEFSSSRGNDPVAGPGFMNLWKKGDPPEGDRLRRGAAALGVGTDAVERSLAVLEPAKSSIGDRDRGALYGLLLTAYEHAKRWETLAATAREALEIWPDSGIAFESLMTALMGLKRLDELEAASEERLSKRPDDTAALRAASRVSVLRGPRENWDAPYRRFIESKKAWLNDYNNYAWAALAFGRASDEDLGNAKHATSDKNPDGPALNTLAAVYAEVGRYAEAKEALLAGMEADHSERPAPADWYVLGRIAEGLGELDEARRDYALSIRDGDDGLTSVSKVARGRLTGLPAPAKPAAGKRASR